ncbi:acyltransferase family protein [Undibacterium sp. TJN19]|uniref:acyltransferase family protein n=1 Tax=Undibacterium sp. TJN19 TaxID=3413055 RepID=UPI003BF27071
MTQKRIYGLDTLRAIAILLVLMSHYSAFVSKQETFGFIGNIGRAGVDLFFVLSGYLIGNQTMSAVAKGQPLSIRNFFARRLLRTLPNYYVVLAAYFIFPAALSGSAVAPLWRFLTFTQNIGLEYGQTFTHSWSLCIEEQFYLILPLLTVLAIKYKNPGRLLWLLLVAGIAAGMTFRGWAWLHNNYDSFSAQVYYSSFGRFDELLPGVAIAMLKNFHPAVYARLLQHGKTLFATGLLATTGVLYSLQNPDSYPFIVTTFGFSLLAISFAILTLSALSPNSPLNRIRLPGATQLALWSYAIYLVHKPVFMVLRAELVNTQIDFNAPLSISAIGAAGVSGGWLLYRLVETPFMKMRARWFPIEGQQTTAHAIEENNPVYAKTGV